MGILELIVATMVFSGGFIAGAAWVAMRVNRAGGE